MTRCFASSIGMSSYRRRIFPRRLYYPKDDAFFRIVYICLKLLKSPISFQNSRALKIHNQTRSIPESNSAFFIFHRIHAGAGGLGEIRLAARILGLLSASIGKLHLVGACFATILSDFEGNLCKVFACSDTICSALPILYALLFLAWNLQTGTECRLNRAVGSVSSIVVDEDLVFAGMEDGNIMAWKWNSESNIHEPANVLKGHNGAVCSLVIGAGKLYSGSTDCTIKWK